MIRIHARVTGVRIWPQTVGGERRSVTIDWLLPTVDSTVKIFESMTITDDKAELNLGDEVDIDIMKTIIYN